MAAIPEMIFNLVTAFLPPPNSEFLPRQLGDSCISYHRNFYGVCVKISDCVPAIFAHSEGIPLEYCQPTGKHGTEQVVCCESSYEPLPKFYVKSDTVMPQRPPAQRGPIPQPQGGPPSLQKEPQRGPPPSQWGPFPRPQWGPQPPRRESEWGPPPSQWGHFPTPQWGPQPPRRESEWGPPPSQWGPFPTPQWGPQPPQREPQWRPHLSPRVPPSSPKESLEHPVSPGGWPQSPIGSQQPAPRWVPPITTPSPTPSTTPEPPLLSDEATEDDTEDDTKDCLSKPDYAVKVKKTGPKSWDECIGYARSVFPCLYSEAKDNEYSQPLCYRDAPSEALEFPHMAMLGFLNGRKIDWRCSGSLISEGWVLTAAHCTHYKGSEVKYVRLGEVDLSRPYYSYELYKVDGIKKPENYSDDSMYHDIALLSLDRLASFTPKVRPACLHAGWPIDDSKMTVTGWSYIYSMGNRTTKLQKVELEKFSHEECSRELPPLKTTPHGIDDSTQICAGHHTSKSDSCKGFSGGPLQVSNDDSVYCTHLIIGVTSFGRGSCGTPGLPAVYTRVSAYIDWIESFVWPKDYV